MKQANNYWRFLVMLFLLGCSNDHGNPAPAETCSAGPDTISFQKNILPIFSSSCALPSCHSSGAPSGNLNLESSVAYSQLSKKGSGYLLPSNPGSSVLYSSLISSSQPMPPTGQLSTCDIQMIANWMSQGAKNN